MDLVNKQVRHKTFGNGSVIKHNDSYIEIQFSMGNKKFVFPDAFKTYLTINDERASSAIKKIIEKKEKERKDEMEIKRVKALLRERQLKILKHEKLMKNKENHQSLQCVFWCKDDEWDKIFMDWSVFTGVINRDKKTN